MDKQVRRLLNQKANKTQLANTIPDKQSMRGGESRFVIVDGALREYTKQHGQLFYIEYSRISVDDDFEIDGSGNATFISLSIDDNASIDSSGDATLNSLDINSNASIDSDGNAILNSITNNGSEEKNIQTVPITSYDVQSSDSVILVDGQPGAVTINLPTPSIGRQLTIKDGGSASVLNVTINQNASEEIDGSTNSYTIDTDYGSVTLISDGTNWFVIGEV